MKVFIIKLTIFFAICLSIITVVLVNYGGNVDYFYEKFTTPKAKSMIIADSRGFQGIQPSVIDNYFEGKGYDLPILNFGFTIAQAVIGPLYNKSIFKKLDTTSNNGIFIISITPDMIASRKNYDNKKGEFREADQPPHNMNFVDINPNYEYLIKNISFFHFKGMFRKSSTLHKDGWLEETNLPKSEAVYNEWSKNQIAMYLRDIDNYELSPLRIQSLDTLMKRLSNFGKVFLLRMPISKEFLGYEEYFYPEFDGIIDSLTKNQNIPYFNFTKIDKIYKTYDGHHLDKYSGKIFTKDLCDLIENSLKKQQ
ncbi:hypothetical protein V8G56_10930 [Gaetbulibacter aquiaggeris]|uniref:SGNH/GDSL hydrolase family protein n=1 Tax=Gaetbulibacter aquiaggeris TaxID=1735373 RepID=A0ABW7MR20_9FLAO